ncbi:MULTISPECIES: amino acid ABC transporter permease [Haematobacter]|uniref:ABC transporter permease n=1 Tax=Haematobacter genomosp. 1 TaxID=366618 RepID=A0A212ADL3_9RHOB|nr:MULTISPECIES: amino acid ABC transporter permease [Haematobacter]OWJ79351.1 ABC transporter permease [Haematobacter genomosp. 1]
MGGSLDFSAVLTGEYLRWLADGLWVTLQLTLGAWCLAFGLAVVLAVLRATEFPPAVWFVSAWVEVHQNIPLLVQVLFWYFAVPELLPEAAREWLYERNSEFILALLAIGFCFSAYMSEALRSGLRAVPRTQYEAGRTFGFGYLQTMRYVIVPQALRLSIPPLVNYSLLLFKNTSIAMAIGVHELTYQSRQIEADTFRTFEIFFVVTAIYLFFSFLIMAVGGLYERRNASAAR